jgi:hypothetical protein
LNSAQFHLATGFGPTFRVKDQSSVLMCGVGPSDSTGKSAVSDCPGGSRLAMSGDCCRPVNPRVIMRAALEVQWMLVRDLIFADNTGGKHLIPSFSAIFDDRKTSSF